MVKHGLGRGLSSLIPSFSPGNESQLELIALSAIVSNPHQPRKQFDQEAFEELVVSIGKHGLVQPIVVRPKESGFELIAGERRWRAAKEAGLKTIPAVVRRSSDSQSLELALIENLQRENLSAIEEAQAYHRLVDEFKLSQSELAQRLGKNRTTIANTLRLLQLSSGLQQLILNGQLSPGHARALLTLPDESSQKKLADRIIGEGLSVRQTETLARLWHVAGQPVKEKIPVPALFKTVSRQLRSFLGTRVKVKIVRNKGKVEIEFKDEAELERILKLVTDHSGK